MSSPASEPKPEKAAAPPRLSLRAYAAHRECSPNAVRKAIATGRLTEESCSRTKGGHWRIDAAAADAEWKANTDPTQQREAHREGEEDDGPSLFPDAGDLPPSQLDPEPPAKRSKADRGTLTELQKVRLEWQNRAAELEYQRSAGDLVPRRDVEREADRVARMTRDALLRIPDRIAAVCASSGDVVHVRETIETEIRAALEVLADQLADEEPEEEELEERGQPAASA